MPSLNGIVFTALLLLSQSVLTFWSFRRDHPSSVVFLVAIVPPVGLPYLLHRDRNHIQDNHIAGTVTYLILLVSALFFLLWYPGLRDEEIPWALIHTMQFFGFLGLANIVMTPYKD